MFFTCMTHGYPRVVVNTVTDLCIWLEILSLLLRIGWSKLVFQCYTEPPEFVDALDCWLKSVKTLTLFKKVLLACKLVFEF
jgi:hypothetical protein